jgi:deazaflavin-dependent oxidoreductase (nitroreductase family)
MSTSISRSLSPRVSGGLPSWLPMLNRVIVGLQRVGFVVGSMHVLAVPGRRSGVLRSTPVSLLTVEGQRYIVAGLEDADWVLNARAAGRGVLQRGRVDEEVALIELPVAERAAVLREFPRLIPQGVAFFARLYGVGADPDAFAGLADRCPVFRVERR